MYRGVVLDLVIHHVPEMCEGESYCHGSTLVSILECGKKSALGAVSTTSGVSK